MCCQDNRRKCGCEKPQHLKEKPQDCTPEQVRACHGEGREHPCVPRGGRA